MVDVADGAGAGTPRIMFAEPEDAGRVLALITLAFAADPPNRWLFPESEQYLQHFPVFVQALGGAALPRRTTLVTHDFSGAALWLTPGAGRDEEALGKLFEENVAPSKRSTIAAVVEEMARYHPEEPHWYLPFIGVDPARQGNGLGSMLLEASLAKCDEVQLPAYLESTNPRNQCLYETYAFEAIAEIRVNDCPPVVPMLRRPRP